VLGLVVLALFAHGSARAQEDNDDSIWNVDKRFYKGFMKALGLKGQNDQEINYRERSPLVVPPSRDLPPPQPAGVRPNDPAWPVDPDQKRRRDAEARSKKAQASYDPLYEGRNLTPSELNAGRGTTGSTSSTSTATNTQGQNPEGRSLLPSQLGYVGGLFSWSALGVGGQKEEVGTFTKEPPRSSLVAPPPGYQTPSPTEKYGLSARTERSKTVPLDPAVGKIE
jgi:hypothetical protein